MEEDTVEEIEIIQPVYYKPIEPKRQFKISRVTKKVFKQIFGYTNF